MLRSASSRSMKRTKFSLMRRNAKSMMPSERTGKRGPTSRRRARRELFGWSSGTWATFSAEADLADSATFSRRCSADQRGATFSFSQRGPDVESEIALSLEEAHRGGSRAISVPTEEACQTCGGSGVKDKRSCPACRGSGFQTRFEHFTVNIPKGVREGSVIRVPRRGGSGMGGGERGDLYLRVHLLPHPTFRIRNESDLEVDLPIAPWEAVLGAKVTVPTLDGPVEMRIPPQSQGGQRLRLRGKGLSRAEGGQGDQYVRLEIVAPPNPSEQERELFRKLAEVSRFDPRSLRR